VEGLDMYIILTGLESIADVT